MPDQIEVLLTDLLAQMAEMAAESPRHPSFDAVRQNLSEALKGYGQVQADAARYQWLKARMSYSMIPFRKQGFVDYVIRTDGFHVRLDCWVEVGHSMNNTPSPEKLIDVLRAQDVPGG